MKNLFHVFLRMFTKFLGEHLSKLAVFLCMALFASTTAFAEEYITDVMVIGGDKDRVDFLKDSCGAQGWTVIDKDLNDNAGVGTDYVYLLYKKSSESGGSNGFITDFIIKTDDYPDSYIFNGRTYYRIPHKGSEHFEIHGGNLNSGTVSSSTNMRLYYTKEEFPDRRVVRDIAFTDAKLKSGYTTLGRNGAVVGSDGSGAMDLNEGAGSSSDYIYMHFATVSSSMDTPEYISDVVVLGGSKDEVNALKERYASRGWIVIDKDLNDNAGAGTDYIYMAYKKSHFSDVNKGFITDFIIKTDEYPDTYKFNGLTYYRAPNFGDGNFAIYGGNLNSGTVSSSTNMWLYFTRESFPDTRVVSGIAFTDAKLKSGYTTLGRNGAVVGSDGSGAMDLNEGAGSSSDYIYMHFATAPSYVNITFVTGLENVSVPSQTVVSGLTPIKPSDPVFSGLKFKGWYADESFTTEFDFSASVTSNTTVYAKWEAAVTFATGLKDVSVPSQTIVYGSTPTKPGDPVFSGLKFKGWYADESFTTEFDFSASVTSNTTVYAKWEASVTFVTGDDNIAIAPQVVLLGNKPTKPADLERSGLTFIGWYTTADGNTQFDFSAAITRNTIVYARWGYLVTFVTGDANVVVPTFVGCMPTKPSDPTREGYKFMGWYTTADYSTEFDFSTPVTSNTTVYAKWWNGDLSILTSDGSYVAEDGYVLKGKLASNSKISIADGATVTLKDVTINGVSDINNKYEWAGINCLGDCNIILEGENSVKGFWEYYPGIHVPEGHTLTIEGNGSLYASSGGWGAGLGGGFEIGCGNIEIKSGTVVATGGKNAAGIGLGEVCDGVETSCGNITIASGVTRVAARGGDSAPYSIGLGKMTGSGKSSVGTITIGGEESGNVSTSPFTFPKDVPYTVVFDRNGGEGFMDSQTLYFGDEGILNSNTFTNEGYFFVGWNTRADGNGEAYDDGATVLDLPKAASVSVTLYAQWGSKNVDISTLTGHFKALNGQVLTGTLVGNTQPYKISIADGATVTLKDVTINGVSDKNNKYKWAGINCLGDCNIILEGENSVKGFWEYYPGIHVPEGHTLTIEGNGSLYASSGGWGAGLGGGFEIGCGNIEIKSGTVVATGGKNAAGIGLGEVCDGVETSCGNITIASGVTRVAARGGDSAPYSIGLGKMTGSGKSSVGTITIGGEESGNVSTSPFTFPKDVPYTVVFDRNGGEGFMDSQTLYFGDEGILNSNTFTNEGYFFVGWNTRADGNGEAYDDGATVLDLPKAASASVTLYAQWVPKSVDISMLTGHFKALNGQVLTGTLDGNTQPYKISIADGATVTLKDVTINGVSDKNNKYKWAGINCLGDCNIILEGENSVKGFWEYYPGIHVPEGHTLTIEGNGSLYASSSGEGAGLGGGLYIGCGNIEIKSGTVVATGGEKAAGIGGGNKGSSGNITISGGTVAAKGGSIAAGIGGGYEGLSGNITISGGSITATGGQYGAGIGGGWDGLSGNITISGGSITATGGQYGAGIGGGYSGSSGDIAIMDGVTLLKASKGEGASFSIGRGESGSVGVITIGGVVTSSVAKSPFSFRIYDVEFDANGGSGVMEKQRFVYNVNPLAIAQNEFIREGYVFVGWNTKADGSGTAYADKEKVQNLTAAAGGVVTLYAQWVPKNVDISTLTGHFKAFNGQVLTGTLDGNTQPYKISIADGATVTLKDVTINGVSDKNNKYEWAGITCLGDCNIILEGENSVKGFWEDYPGILVPEGHTLTIEGNGSLDASSSGWGAGLGGGFEIGCGNIEIKSGTVVATGGKNAAGIGLGEVRDGEVTSCGNITIASGVTRVTAIGGESAPYSIGLGLQTGGGKSSVGKITIGNEVMESVSTNPYTYPNVSYTVFFDKNGGSGSMESQTLYVGNGMPLNRNIYTRQGYVFIGWNTSKDGTGEFYHDGATVLYWSEMTGKTLELYAQWGNLSDLKNDFIAQDGDILTGTLDGSSQPYKISIADGATVTLKDVTINGVSDKNNKYKWAGITCLGDCKIILEGENSVKGFWEDYPGIFVPEGHTLTIEGNGSLYASSSGWGAGLGGGFEIGCGNIEIKSGTVVATGGKNAAGIGLGEVRDGEVTSCGNITIASGVTRVTAIGGESAPYSIGLGKMTGSGQSSVGTIAIGGEVTGNVSKSPFTFPKDVPYTVVFDRNGGEGFMDSQTLYFGDEGILNSNTFTNEGYFFVGWNTRADGNGEAYDDGATVLDLPKAASASVTLYAQWIQIYDVEFDANGGTGNMEKQRFVYEAEPTVLTKNTFTREGYTFVGWNTKADGSGTTYADEEKVRNLTDEAGGKVTLYAQWGMPYIDGNGKEQIKQSGEYIVLTGTTDVSTLSSGWYVVMGEVTYENSFDFAGKDVHLILADGAKLTVVNNRADAKTEFNNLSIYAQSKDDKMGAFVVNSSNGDAIKVDENFVINGGAVTAAGSVDAKVFLAGGSAKAYGYKGSVSVKEGLFYTDGKGNSYTAGENGSINVVNFNGENVTSSFSLNMIADKNMHPYIPAIQFREFTKDGKTGTLAELNANYNEIVPFGISEEMTVDSVEFKREFTTVTNGYATVIFPFDVQANNLEGVETVVAFGGVNKQYQVLMNVVWDKNKPSDYTLKAHTPYMVHMNQPTLNIHGPVTLKPIKEKTYEVEIGNWKFIGTYVFKEWGANDKDLGHAYGYTTVSTNNFSAGQFVIIAKNAITRAFRAYLVETQPQAIVARKPSQSNAGSQIVTSSSNSRPDYMDVIIVDKDEDGKEHTTVIGRFNTRTGEIKLNPVGNRVYDLKGRSIRKDAKKAKGVYYGKNAAR